MFTKNYQATHPDMMADVRNEQLRERYLVTGLFAPDRIALNYSHNERFVIGGAAPVSGPVQLPKQTEPASAAGSDHEPGTVSDQVGEQHRTHGIACIFYGHRSKINSDHIKCSIRRAL